MLALRVTAMSYETVTLCCCVDAANTPWLQSPQTPYLAALVYQLLLLVLLLVPLLPLQAIQHPRASEHFLAVPSSAAGGLQPPAEPHATGSCVQDT